MALTDKQGLVREPMYQQMNQILRALLRNGEFAQGDQFLTERQIAERFQVSRPTANKVLAGMVSEGLLEFRKGVGTFVSAPRLNYDIQSLVSFTEKAKEAGKTPSTRVLEFERIKASEVEAEIAQRLQVDLKRELFAISRLRLADGVPVILEQRWLPTDIFPGLSRQQLRGSFYALCRDQYGLRIEESDQTLRAVKLRGVAGSGQGCAGLSGFCRRILRGHAGMVGKDPLPGRYVRVSPGALLAGKIDCRSSLRTSGVHLPRAGAVHESDDRRKSQQGEEDQEPSWTGMGRGRERGPCAGFAAKIPGRDHARLPASV
jgi:GntR family transcriptional regulator